MIVWDLGGVRAVFEPARRLTALADATGLRPERIEEAIWKSGLDAAAERGALDEDSCWSETLAASRTSHRSRAAPPLLGFGVCPRPAVIASIDRLEHRGALFRDNGPILEACLRHELAALSSRFQHSLLSWRLGATKSNPVAYHRAARTIDLPAAALTLIEDLQTTAVTPPAPSPIAERSNLNTI